LLARGRVEVSPPPASPSPALILATLEDNNRLLYTKHGSAGNTQLSLPPVRGRNGLWTGGNGKGMRGGQKTLSNFRRGTATCRCHWTEFYRTIKMPQLSRCQKIRHRYLHSCIR
jgi:hypothetical protein